MTPELLRDIVDLLIPMFTVSASRQALVGAALFNCPVLRQIEWEGPPQVFTINMLQKLIDFGDCRAGESSVVTLLNALRPQMGEDKYPKIDAIIRQVSANRR